MNSVDIAVQLYSLSSLYGDNYFLVMNYHADLLLLCIILLHLTTFVANGIDQNA